jgi:hypothetical protein
MYFKIPQHHRGYISLSIMSIVSFSMSITISAHLLSICLVALSNACRLV